jgi:hypothetical protein
LHQLRAVAVDGEQARCVVVVALGHLAVIDVEYQALAVDPLEAADVGVVIRGHDLAAVRLQVDDHQEVALAGCAAARGNRAAIWRQQAAIECRVGKETLDRRHGGRGLRLDAGGGAQRQREQGGVDE